MSSPGGLNAGGEGVPKKWGPGHLKGNGKEAAMPASTPPASRKHGRPKGSRNLKSLAALAAAAAVAPTAATAIEAAPALDSEDAARKRGLGRPKGSEKKAALVTAATPPPPRRHGRPPGSKNKKTLAALRVTSSSSAGPRAAASPPAGSSRSQLVLLALQPPAYVSAEGWSTFIVSVLAGAKDRLRLPS
jgi:hypothetical protein